MTLFAYLAGSDLGYRIRLGAMGLTERADGTQGFGQITFDDPDKTLTVRGWMEVIVRETACTSAPVLFRGYVGPRTYSRSSGNATYKTDGARFIDTTLVDSNVLLDMRLFTGNDAKRPAETEAERIAWMLSDGAMVGYIEDTSLVNDSDPVDFGDADYKYQYPSNVMEDLAAGIGKTYFIYIDGLTGDRGLFYDLPDAAVSSSTLSISNDLSDITLDANGDVTGDVFPPFIDAASNLDPSQVVAKVVFGYQGGNVTQNSATTEATFFEDPGLGYRGIHIENSRVGLEATARGFANQYLTQHGAEEEKLTCAVIVPKEKAGLIRAGQRIQVKFTHLDGLESFTWRRITERQIAHADQTNDRYLIVLELNNRAVTATGPSGGAPPPSDFPHTPPGIPGVVQSKYSNTGNLPPDHPVTDGDFLIAWVTSTTVVGPATTPGGSGWTTIGTCHNINEFGDPTSRRFGVAFYKIADGEPSTYVYDGNISMSFVELTPAAFGAAVAQSEMTGTGFNAGGAITPASADALVFGCGILGQFNPGGATYTVAASPSTVEIFDGEQGTAGATPFAWVGYKAVATPASTTVGGVLSNNIGPTYNQWAGVTFTVLPADPQDNAPAPGQWVRGESVGTGDGSTTTFTTIFPFADGSLVVYVDRLDQTAAVTSYDGATGSFTLGFAPTVGELVEVDYQGRGSA